MLASVLGGNLGIDFLPERILQAEYESRINHQVMMTTGNHFHEIPTNFICSINQLLDNNIIINEIVKVSQIYGNIFHS